MSDGPYGVQCILKVHFKRLPEVCMANVRNFASPLFVLFLGFQLKNGTYFEKCSSFDKCPKIYSLINILSEKLNGM